jgi:hypothetical protein
VEFVLIDQEAEAAAAAADYEQCIEDYENQLDEENRLLYLAPPDAGPVECPASSHVDAASFPTSRGEETEAEWGDEDQEEEEVYDSLMRTALVHHSNHTSFDTPAFAGVVQWKGKSHTLRAPNPHALWP